MRVRFTWLSGAVALSALGLGCLTPAVASAWRSHKPPTPPTLFVNGSILSGYGHNSCSAASYATIGEAGGSVSRRYHARRGERGV